MPSSWSNLVQYLEASASRAGSRPAVVGPGGATLSFAELDDAANRVAAFLRRHGVRRGERVGVILAKSEWAVAILFGVMKAGAAYVPADYTAPWERNLTILTDCQVSLAFLDPTCMELAERVRRLCEVVIVGEAADGPDRDTPWQDVLAVPPGELLEHPAPSDTAYILYTSGSTGIPKGVTLTHENATSFVDWCSEVFAPDASDRFSSHAPFHFDLSVLDIYVSVKHASTLYLVAEELGKSPRDLARFIAAHRLTIWYSTPSILTLLAHFGSLADYDWSSLRTVLFAGEVFPVKHLRALQQFWPLPRYYNLYGPTETNVCTFAAIPSSIPPDRSTPFPIGPACSHCRTLVLDESGDEVSPADEGLLYVSGPSVFQGYWNRPHENQRAFVVRDGNRWYNTGDVVRQDPVEGFIYIGRRDRMVKRRGYRIELGEVERALYRHERIREVAVVASLDPELGVRLRAHLSVEGPRPSIIALKTFCAEQLPSYMSPDEFVIHDRLPRTSTDKVDYQALQRGETATAVRSRT